MNKKYYPLADDFPEHRKMKTGKLPSEVRALKKFKALDEFFQKEGGMRKWPNGLWSQKYDATLENGFPVDTFDPYAVKFSVRGCLKNLCDGWTEFDDVYRELLLTFERYRVLNGWERIKFIDWHNQKGRTIEEIRHFLGYLSERIKI